MRYFLATMTLVLLAGCGQTDNKQNTTDRTSTPNRASATSNDNSANDTATTGNRSGAGTGQAGTTASNRSDATTSSPATNGNSSNSNAGSSNSGNSSSGSASSSATKDAKSATGAAFDKSKLDVLDQKENKKDVDITANIRKRIVDAKDLSTSAHNVTIITKDGNVTLSGPVKNDAEKQEVERIARDIAGAGEVSNHLEVK